LKTFHAKTGEQWQHWLQRNYLIESEVWLLFFKKEAKRENISYDGALDLALCYGWIDSLVRRIDDKKYARKFTPRKTSSIWSKSNIVRMERLIKDSRMTERGRELFKERSPEISFAEKFATNELPFPDEFMTAIQKNQQAWQNFQAFSPSHKRQYQMWVTSAKRDETRKRTIKEAVALISKNVRSLMK
jgi:uncharacterized protein YdeI (YjbR/CyaY-like superfamily)